MKQELVKTQDRQVNENHGSLLIGTGLAVVSMILIPAFAARIGLGASVTGALRMAMMKASHQALRG